MIKTAEMSSVSRLLVLIVKIRHSRMVHISTVSISIWNLSLTLRTPTLFNTLRTPRGGFIEPPFYLRCLPTDLDEIFTQCHVWYKLSKKYRTCSLRPIWRQLWRHNDFLKNGFSRIFKLFIFYFWNKIFRDEIPSPICCLICYTFEKNKKMAGKNR